MTRPLWKIWRQSIAPACLVASLGLSARADLYFGALSAPLDADPIVASLEFEFEADTLSITLATSDLPPLTFSPSEGLGALTPIVRTAYAPTGRATASGSSLSSSSLRGAADSKPANQSSNQEPLSNPTSTFSGLMSASSGSSGGSTSSGGVSASSLSDVSSLSQGVLNSLGFSDKTLSGGALPLPLQSTSHRTVVTPPSIAAIAPTANQVSTPAVATTPASAGTGNSQNDVQPATIAGEPPVTTPSQPPASQTDNTAALPSLPLLPDTTSTDQQTSAIQTSINSPQSDVPLELLAPSIVVPEGSTAIAWFVLTAICLFGQVRSRRNK